MRTYIEKVVGDDDSDFGLPHKIVAKQPVSVNMSRAALNNVYMMEFHPSLAIASRIPDALKHAYWAVHHQQRPNTVTEQLIIQKRLMELVVQQWETTRLQPLGATFAPSTQRDLFGDGYAEDPKLMVEVLHTVVHNAELGATRKSQKDRHMDVINACANILELLTSRLRLIDAACETEVLSKIYRRQAREMGYEECHLFLRFVQFEFANFKEKLRTPPIFITAVQEDGDDTSVDRYIPNNLYLAIHELDESNVGRSVRLYTGVVWFTFYSTSKI